MPAWGKFADKYGNKKVLQLTGFFLPIVPLFWFATIFIQPSLLVGYLFLIEAVTGVVWAGFNLAAGNFIYDAVSRQRIAICVSYFNIIAGIGVLLGSSLGGLISSLKFSFFGLSPILFVILLSAIVRFLVYILMGSKFQEVREVQPLGIKQAGEKIRHLSLSKFQEYFDIHPAGILKSKPAI